MAYNFGWKSPDSVHLWITCDLDGLPLHAARNRYGHLHPLSDRGLGHNAWFWAICRETENQSLLALQSWTAVLAITAMALSAGMAERERAAEALRESEASMSLAANAANLGLWVWNIPSGEERWVTEKWRQLFGFADSEPVTFDRFLEVVHPGDSERVKQVVQHILEHGGEYEIEYRITRPDGSIRWIATHGRVELDERGKPVLARGVSRDVTKRKIAEEDAWAAVGSRSNFSAGLACLAR